MVARFVACVCRALLCTSRGKSHYGRSVSVIGRVDVNFINHAIQEFVQIIAITRSNRVRSRLRRPVYIVLPFVFSHFRGILSQLPVDLIRCIRNF
jgi:hypothetical protein